MSTPLITIEHLQTFFDTEEGTVRAVDDVSLTIFKGRTLGLVGESGCGKSVTAMSIIRLISPPGRIVGGRIVMHGSTAARPLTPALSHEGRGRSDAGANAAAVERAQVATRPVSSSNAEDLVLTELSEPQMRTIRGGRISMIFQEPMTSLNPVFTVGAQISEAILLHQQVSKAEARNRAIDMLARVKISEPRRRFDEYPHQFSGGMRQRAMIAMALTCHPQLLIADEPTTALDVTIQAQILELLRELQSEMGMSILLITHDLGIIAEMADEVAVMYASKVVEYAPVESLFARPLHPYTQGLLRSRPSAVKSKHERLTAIPGMVPSPLRFPAGCKFHPRCAHAKDRCLAEEPALREIHPGHFVRCHLAEELAARGNP